MGLTDLGVSLVKLLPPEAAHTATIRALEKGLGAPLRAPTFDPILATTLPKSGLELAAPVGLAAGFDKNCDVPSAMALALTRLSPNPYRISPGAASRVSMLKTPLV